jgi:hypothetical protein
MSRRIFRITAAFGKIFGMGGYLKAMYKLHEDGFKKNIQN